MTTPLGTLDVQARDARRVTRRAARPARPTSRSRSTSTAPAPRSIATGHRVLRPPPGVARPPRPVRPRDPGDRRPRGRRAPHGRGRRARAGRGVRGGARRPGRDPPLRRQQRPDGRERRDGGHRRRRPAVRRDRPAVPRRARRAAPAPARRPRAGVVRADRRRDPPPARDGPQRPPPRRGGVQGARPRAARRLRARSPARPASPPRRARSGDRRRRRRPLVVVVDYGAGNLVSIDQALRAAGADVRLATSGDEIDGADLLVVPGRRRRRARDGAPPRGRLRRPDHATGSPPTGRSSASASASSSCSRARDEDGAETLGVLPGRTVRLDDAPTLPHIGWNQVVRRREHPAFAGIAPDADFYFVHSYVGAARRRGAATPSSPRPSTARRSCPRSRAAACSASSSTPSGPGTDGLRAASPTSSRRSAA